jgi:hypothetical protein
MRTLRTPKYLTGPDLGIPSLTPRAYYEAQFGDGSWEKLGLIPKDHPLISALPPQEQEG